MDGENSETVTWLSFAKDCSYLSSEEYLDLSNRCNEVGKMIGSMPMKPEPFLLQIVLSVSVLQPTVVLQFCLDPSVAL